MNIAIVTPTGNIGAGIVQNLLPTGAKLTLLQRDPAKLSDAVRARTRVEQGSLEDAAFVRKATQGVDVLFWLTPYSLAETDQKERYRKLMASAGEAVTANGIPYVVNLSSFGAQRREGAGFASYVGRMEDCLNTTGANVLHLRPGFFMENFLLTLPWIQGENSIPLPMPAATVLPMIATADIAAAAAKRLLSQDWQGQVVEGLHGPEDLCLEDAGAILAEATGRPLRYLEAPWAMFDTALRSMGASDAGVRCDVELMTAFATPGIVAEPRTTNTTTRTTLSEWGQTVLKPLLDAGAG